MKIALFLLFGFASFAQAAPSSRPAKKKTSTTPAQTVKRFANAMIQKNVKLFVSMWYEKEIRGKEKRLKQILLKHHKPMKILAKGMLDALKKKNPFKKVKSVLKLPTLAMPYLGINRRGNTRVFKLILVSYKGQWKVADID